MSEAEAFERILASLHEGGARPWQLVQGPPHWIDEALGTHGNSLTLG